ncbi:hypothetical protein [Chitinilyticum litopenaei]|uniref:hypothetical protein n=1 Tax=Chitinilyticum litopenaei TaxID=1121276 RepID=UPI000400BCF7|nr:hypothetical protein [Chitinilyticum litopenaei]
MSFYLRPDQVPELQGLSKMEQRILLRGTFLKERAMSTVVLLLVIIGSIQFGINPLIEQLLPTVRTDSMLYAGILIAWFLLLMTVRDIVMMNVLRPKFAAKRAEQTAERITRAEQGQGETTGSTNLRDLLQERLADRDSAGQSSTESASSQAQKQHKPDQ